MAVKVNNLDAQAKTLHQTHARARAIKQAGQQCLSALSLRHPHGQTNEH
jgi:hypothetical protein